MVKNQNNKRDKASKARRSYRLIFTNPPNKSGRHTRLMIKIFPSATMILSFWDILKMAKTKVSAAPKNIAAIAPVAPPPRETRKNAAPRDATAEIGDVFVRDHC
ncbi:hypothetical protein HKBW3C_01496, partial [Candidatus Hakubella thermalkaliphila]